MMDILEQILFTDPQDLGKAYQHLGRGLPPALFVHSHGTGADLKPTGQFRLAESGLPAQCRDSCSQHPKPPLPGLIFLQHTTPAVKKWGKLGTTRFDGLYTGCVV